MIDGLRVVIGPQALVVTSASPLQALSSAVFRGGLVTARSIVNVHVDGHDGVDPEAALAAYLRDAGLPAPCVGLLTGARTECATVGEESAWGYHAVAAVTVGLGNRIAAGASPVARWSPSTINTIVVVDAAPEPAALVNAVITVTEVKALALRAAGLATADGPASGTSTDAVVIAATGRGRAGRFAGPVSELGWVIARAARQALTAGVRAWVEERR